MSGNPRVDRRASRGLLAGILWIVLAGAAMGTVYNALGLVAERPWGLPWTALDKLEALPGLEQFQDEAPAPASACPTSHH